MAKRPSRTASPEPGDYQSFLRRLLADANKPMKLDQILRMAHVPRHRKREVEATLAELTREGHVLRLHGGMWMAAELVRTLVGRYGVQRSGAGFVAPQAEEGDRWRGKGLPLSVFIHPTQAGDAWHGDVVRVALLPGKATGKNPEGRIVEVVERGQKELTVRAIKPVAPGDTQSFLCRPADPRFSFNMQVNVTALERVPERGDLLLVRVGEQLASDLWTGAAHAVFGREDDVAVQEQLVKLNHQVPLEFPQAALQEAAALPPDPRPEDYAEREDVRHIPFVTIDGRTARDFDDAVHVEPRGKGWVLRVGIADVTHYVRPRSALDMEARDRANSWYFPVSVEPMLPPVLSNGLCSLNPDVDRLVMLAEIVFGPEGQPLETRFAAGVLRSAARLTYGQVKRLVLDNDGQGDGGDAAERAALLATPRGGEVLPMLEEAQRLARVLAKRRKERGSLDFNLPEPEYFFDAEGRIVNIGRKERHFAHQLIEEFMIAANEAVARFLEERDMPFLYRVHPEPDPARLEGLFRTLASTSVASELPPRPDAQALQAVLRAASGGPQEFLVGRLALRTMPQARYQPENEGHFGLASECYCHFTSPIRRYADVVVHRALKRALGMDPGAIPAAQKLLALGDQCNRREREAMEAEREMARRLGTLVLRDRVGEEFTGIISGVTDFGFFVELDAMPVEGMVRIADLGDDYFEFDAERQELTGVMSGVRFALGQAVRTRLVEVNPGRLEITLTLLEMPAPSVQGRKRGLGLEQGARPAMRMARRTGTREGDRGADRPGGKKAGGGKSGGRSGGANAGGGKSSRGRSAGAGGPNGPGETGGGRGAGRGAGGGTGRGTGRGPTGNEGSRSQGRRGRAGGRGR